MHEDQNRNWYILSNIRNRVVTFQVRATGMQLLRHAGIIGSGDKISPALFKQLCHDGGIYTKRTSNKQNKLLFFSINLFAKDEDGWTDLMRAAYNGNVEIVKSLIKEEGNINARDKNGWSALMCATAKGHTEIIKLLKDKGAVY